MSNIKVEITNEMLEQIAGGIYISKSGVEYYKADDKYIYYRHMEQEHKVAIRDLQSMLGRSSEEMKAFTDKINDDKIYRSK